ncbi:hypothetical protein [Ohtaekwangia koreensis]|uniref:Uncharacterized protein n=1 Tax=Ohtaekwangia koreensis TaxID=688867 RepID=A0A1T5KR19_9BACT|nr:hypothetical protein [Ohtaekwangia koreensis]SKC65925.1 hypothetical protein SAMN05660236_2477 [Ohtaekwangia koreensis]
MSTEILDNIQHFGKDTNCIRLLKKYATLLTVFMVIGYVLDVGGTALFGLLADDLGVENTIFIQYIYLIPRFIMSLTTTTIVYQDMKRTNSYSGAILGLTIFFDEIGATFFIIYVMYNELSAKSAKV